MPKRKPHVLHQSEQGFMLVILLMTTTFILLVGVATAHLSLSNLQLATSEYYRVNTQFAADAGLDAAVQELNQDSTWTGSAGEINFLEDSKMKVTYATTVTDGATNDVKYISVTARTYVPKTSASPKTQRKFEVKMRGVSGGSYSVVTGVGGLYMSNNAKIVGGNVYVNGEIGMSNSAQIGLTTNPVSVSAAHQNCPSPADGTYPRVCASGESGQPITLANSARIYGEVQATNQTNGSGMSLPGLVAGSPPPAALPTHDRAAQSAAVASTVTASSVNCNSGTYTWAANLKITGNVSIGNTCKVTVLGDVWITGTLSVSNSAELIVSDSLSTPPVVMIDGSSGLSAVNGALLKSNAASVGFRVVTYASAASCSPGCASVTGTDLYNSRNQTTISLDNSAAAPNTEFFARWTRVLINNSGNIGALVGQTVELRNSATITFGTSVTGSGISAWVIDSYKRDF